MNAAAAHDPSAALQITMTAAIVIGYWAPAIVAFVRRVPNKVSVLVINLFLGWTLIGWVVALAMAVRSRPQPAGPVSITNRGHGISR